MSKLPPPEERFHQVAVAIATNLHNIICDLEKEKKHIDVKSSVTQFGYDLIRLFPPKKLIKGFTARSYTTWNKIIDRDESFFISSADTLFAELPSEDVHAFKKLVEKDANGSRLIDDDDVEMFWRSFTSLVRIMISYLHDKYKSSPAILKLKIPGEDGKVKIIEHKIDYMSYATRLNYKLE